MITLIELNHTLTKVGTEALALTSRTCPSRSRSLCEVLRGAVWMLAGDVQDADTPLQREARRQLHLETIALLAEIELALRHPTAANHYGVRHRARAWNELLEHVRPALGIGLGRPELHGPLGVRPVGASRAGGFFT
ncbi:MAG: hypothetical protein J0J01_29780 [Reyranella sp.]|uniref:hypothetical protein n=1 Tax=Reyranella sp. TaxID=1929291 RepID=UPI001ACE91F4|nr:hypothetical protein [Reyranella sp.]MBN9091127.1 hypothetical protein [Reyranella sp.]